MRCALVAGLALVLLAGGGASAAGSAPSASAQAWAVRVVVPGSRGGGTPAVSAPRAAGRQADSSFVYPADGSVIVTGAVRASAATATGREASATAMSAVAAVSIFGGEITVSSLTGAASGRTHKRDASGSFDGTAVAGLVALGSPVTKDTAQLADWGTLSVRSTGVDTSAPPGAAGYSGFVTAVDIRLTAAHGGLPAGSEIQLGHVEVGVSTAPAAAAAPEPSPKAPSPSRGPMPGDRPQLLPHVTGPLVGVPQLVTPALDAGPYVFPVYGASSYGDAYGADRPDATFHHGDDIFGELGQPVLAAANGTVFSLGWNRPGGNRLWLRDHQGNLFYYAHLAAFSTNARNGARVQAGEVIGFMGNTGDGEGAATHLHFEVHPVSLIYLGHDDGAVDPTTYLASWKRIRSLPFPVATGWAPSPPGVARASLPGALLIGSTDIASGGLGAARP